MCLVPNASVQPRLSRAFSTPIEVETGQFSGPKATRPVKSLDVAFSAGHSIAYLGCGRDSAVLWRLAIQVTPGGYQVIGEVEAASFEEACHERAERDPDSGIQVVGSLATCHGHAVIVLRDDASLAGTPGPDA